MKWIKLKYRAPDKQIDGEKVLVYRIVNRDQESLSISIYDTEKIKFCNKDETWWMCLPEKPINICYHNNEIQRQGDGFVYTVCGDCGEEL